MSLRKHSAPDHLRGRFQRGLSLIEFAFVAGLLVILLVAGTDYSLSILARQEIHSAAKSGMEFAINRGYDPNGIQVAARNPRGVGSPGLRFASIVSVTSDVKCACYADFTSWTSPRPSTSSSPQYCVNSCAPIAIGGISIPESAYATVTVTGAYTPFFPLYWANLQGGTVPLSATYVAKTFFTR
jgi:Flp pilus assembly protein TadG